MKYIGKHGNAFYFLFIIAWQFLSLSRVPESKIIIAASDILDAKRPKSSIRLHEPPPKVNPIVVEAISGNSMA